MLEDLLKFFKQINKILLYFIAINFVLVIFSSIMNLEKHNYDSQVWYIWVILIANSILSIYLYPKDKIIPYIFNLTTLFVTILSIILIVYY